MFFLNELPATSFRPWAHPFSLFVNSPIELKTALSDVGPSIAGQVTREVRE